MRKLTTVQFITKAKEIHGEKYSYELVEYINNATKVKIICHEHGIFKQMPKYHIRGFGCSSCSNKKPYTIDTFITKAKEVHGDRYDYSNIIFKNLKSYGDIICPIHGVFNQVLKYHISGNGCSKCANIENGKTKKLTTEEFITKAKEMHGDRYSYELVEYGGTLTKVKIICPIHGVFEQRPNDHLQKHGCPLCAQIISKQEIEFTDYIKSVYDGTVIANSRRVIPPYELDVYLPDLKIAFEYNGTYWHNEGVTKPIGYHQMKTNRCKAIDITLHHIWEDEWMNNREECKEVVGRVVL